MSKAKKKAPTNNQIPGLDFLSNITNFDMPEDFDFNLNDDNDFNDDELERELQSLNNSSQPRAKAPQKQQLQQQQQQRQNQIRKTNNQAHDINKLHQFDLDNLLRDNFDDEIDDETDEDLENELKELESDNDEEKEEKSQLKVVTKTALVENNEQLKLLENNLTSFHKKLQDPSIDDAKKRRFKRNIEQYENAIKACKAGKTFDYSSLPGFDLNAISGQSESVTVVTRVAQPPPIPKRPELEKNEEIGIEQESNKKEIIQPPSPPKRPSVQKIEETQSEDQLENKKEKDVTEVSKKVAPKPPMEKPKTTLEALEQLNDDFNRRISEANESGDTSKARRFERNQKLVKTALDACKKGKQFNYAELNPLLPPGFPQLPLEQAQSSSHASNTQQPQEKVTPKSQPSPIKPVATTRQSPQANKICLILKKKQQLFKEAAIKAKQDGNQNLALQYLKNFKGFDDLIKAAENGLPVDLSRVPDPPQLAASQKPRSQTIESDFQNDEIDNTRLTGDRSQVYKKLEEHLRNQIRIAVANSQHFTKLNDQNNAIKFKNLETECMKDLKILLDANKQGYEVPKYHFETRKYEMINCCLDLKDTELELKIIRGINLAVPSGYDTKSFQTYVKFDFPFPDGGQSDKTSRQYGDCPEYNNEYKLKIERNQKFLRVVNRKEIKIEIYQKMGLFKSDKLIASSNIKLQPLETKCVVHDSYDLLEGRKRTSGKLECELRVKEPFLHKEIQLFEDKWLVIDKILPKIDSNPKDDTKKKILEEIHSLEVLNFDRNLIEKQIETYRDRLSKTQLFDLLEKSEHLNQESIKLKEKLKSGGTIAISAYLSSISSLVSKYEALVDHHVSLGDTHKAELFKKRKEIVELEISKITDKLKINI